MLKSYFEDSLIEYCEQDKYPWHMPGHKRNVDAEDVIVKDVSIEDETVKDITLDDNAVEESITSFCKVGKGGIKAFSKKYDVTELPGLDDLHCPENALRKSMEQLSIIYGSFASYYMVNGSTGGILAAISAVCSRGDTIIMARHCHKSIYHAVSILNLIPQYIYPDVIEPWKINGSLNVDKIHSIIDNNPSAKAIILPSPTYDGIVSDIRAISQLAHEHGMLLIVDAAHGAHLEFDCQQIESAIRAGADLVIESLHKTLPCYTQCAILHIGATAVEIQPNIKSRIERYLNVYETSSPSYLFVADMEHWIIQMSEWRHSKMMEYKRLLDYYRSRWVNLHSIHVLSSEDVISRGAFQYDETKIVISHNHLSGEELRELFESRFGIVMEMTSLKYVLAISSVMDSKEAFEVLDTALHEIENDNYSIENGGNNSKTNDETNSKIEIPVLIACNEKLIPGEAWNYEMERINLSASVGRIAADYITVYPPGIPVCVPGEVITQEAVDYLIECINAKLTVNGIYID